MKMDWRPAAILLVTLGLGVALGLVVRGTVTRERDRRVAELRTAPGFESLVMEVIEPRQAQEDSIRPILEASAHRYDSLVSTARVGLGLVLDSMKLKLTPLLDARQRERLARMTTLPDPNRRPPRPGERPREEGGPQGNPPRDNPPRAGGQQQGNPPPREAGPPRDNRPRDGAPPPRDGAPPPRRAGPPRDNPPPPGGRPPANRPGEPPPDRPPPPK